MIKTWGLVPTSSGTRCVRLELRAETGIMFRVSGVSHQAMMAAQARIRSALLSVDCKWPGKAITLHVSESCHPDQIRHLDLPLALAMLAVQPSSSRKPTPSGEEFQGSVQTTWILPPKSCG